MPRVKGKVDRLLQKSIDSSLLAVEVYNKPRTAFRSGAYIVLMCIAWTSLFHAIFEKQGIPYYYKRSKRRYEIVDGERKAWELSECIKKYFQGNITPESKNLDFFVKIRNKVEHRFLPELDMEIFGECQAMLMNYERLLVKEFGDRYSINQNLVFALQFSRILDEKQKEAIKARESEEFKDVKTFINTYRGRLRQDIADSMNYNFRVYVMPKITGNKKSADFTLEFIKMDTKNSAEVEELKKFLVAIKEKKVQRDDLLKAGDVAVKVYEKLKDKMAPDWKFTAAYHHARCYKYYKIRPLKTTDPDHEKTNQDYCLYDKTFDQYVYTEQWVNFLVSKLQDPEEYKKVMSSKV